MRLPHSFTAWLLRRRHFLIPAALLIALWLPAVNQGWYRTDTHFYAAIGRQAFDRAAAASTLGEKVHALVFLQAGDQPYLNKPPLPFWLHGAAIRLFGLDLWTVRLPSLIAAIGGAWAAAFIVARLGTRRIAMVGGLVLATTVEYFRYTRAISLDLWMTMFMLIALAMCAAAVASRKTTLERAWPLLASGIPLGLALLCKPMVALICPVIVAAWLVWIGKPRLVFAALASVFVAFIVAAPWHIAMAMEYPDTFLKTYFIKQSLDRATSESAEPFWYYLALLGETYWPWLITLVLAAVTWARGGWPLHTRAGRLIRLAFVWSIVWLIALSAFGGKAPRYLAPVLPLLAVFSAAWLVRGGSGRGVARKVGRALFVWGAPAALLIGLAVALSGVKVHAPRESRWDELLREVDARPDARLYTTTRQHPIAANLVMLGREWPPVYDGLEARENTPRPPRLLMMHPDEPLPGPNWFIVAKLSGMQIALDPGTPSSGAPAPVPPPKP